MKNYVIPLLACVFLMQMAAEAQESPQILANSNTARVEGTSSVVNGSRPMPVKKGLPLLIQHIAKPPVIDGKLREGEWNDAAVITEFFQVKPGDNLAPSAKTEIRIAYDEKNLYIAFLAFDSPDQVRVTVAKRDAVTSDDIVGVLLDTFNDHRKAYVLAFNPLGVQQDAIYTEGQGADYSVDIIMQSKGELTQNGYVVEVAIPFSSLRYEAGKGKFWGMHAFREIKRLNNEVISWMPVLRGKAGILNQAGQVTGLNEIAEKRTLEIIPSVAVSESGRRIRTISKTDIRANPALRDPGRLLNEPVKVDPGLTLKLALTRTVILDVAANPDFAQVEADQPVITANQRFPIFFAEKRPFFLEGIDIFRTQLNPVHTRTIIDPDLAIKLTGKQGRTSFGLMLASDNAPGNFSEDERTDPDTLPAIERFLDKNSYVGVLRLKRDVGKESNIGLLATSYNFIEKHNQVGGFDGRFRLDQRTVFDFQVLGTTSRRFFFDPDLGRKIYRTGNGAGYAFRLEQIGRHFGYEINGEGRTSDYRADVGFTRRTNTNREGLSFRYNSEPKPGGLLISWRLSNDSTANFDWHRNMQSWSNLSKLAFILPKQTAVNIAFTRGYERVFEEEFGPRRSGTRPGAFAGTDPERSAYQKGLIVSGETTPSKKYSFVVAAGFLWGALDYDLGAGPRFPRVSPAALNGLAGQLDPGPGDLIQIQAVANYQPTAALKTSLLYTKSRLIRYDTDLVAFDDNIFSSRTTYQFSRFIFARSRIDYSTLSTRVRAQFLLGWTPSPGTAFYAGMNEDFGYNGFSPFTGQPEPGFHRFGRTFYVKTSYLLRK